MTKIFWQEIENNCEQCNSPLQKLLKKEGIDEDQIEYVIEDEDDYIFFLSGFSFDDRINNIIDWILEDEEQFSDDRMEMLLRFIMKRKLECLNEDY